MDDELIRPDADSDWLAPQNGADKPTGASASRQESDARWPSKAVEGDDENVSSSEQSSSEQPEPPLTEPPLTEPPLTEPPLPESLVGDPFAEAQVETPPRLLGVAGSSGKAASFEPSPDAPTVIRTRSSAAAELELVDVGKRLPGTELVGMELGHYRLEELVGGGGMGSVYRGTDIELGRPVAVKVISAVANSQDALKRFKVEAQNAARLDHANIARVYYVGETDAWNYIVFEYVEGENLRERVMRSGPLPIEDVLLYAAQVAEALDHASERNVVHRDIKPSNIVLQPDGNVKLVDMGLARFHHGDGSADEITASEVILGTFDYISPEQAKNSRNADVRSDLYSLGCTMYFLLTGAPPFPQENALQKLLSHTGDAPPDPRELRPELDVGVTDFIHRLMAKDPERRFQTPREFTGQLIILSSDLAIPLGGRKTRIWVERPEPGTTTWHVHLAWAVPAVLLLAFVLAIHWSSASESVSDRFASYLPPLASEEETASDTDSADDATQPDPVPPDAATAEQARISEDVDTPTADEFPNTAKENETTNPDGSTPDRAGRDTIPGPGSRDTGTPESRDGDTGPANSGATIENGPSKGAESGVGDDSDSTEGAGGGSEANDRDEGRDSVPPIEAMPPSRVTGEDPIGRPSVGDRLIVVSDEAPLDEDVGLWRKDLISAIRVANENPNISRIELRYDGPRVQQPTRLTNKQHLTIAAAAGFSPSVLFRPDLDSLLGTKQMLEVAGSRVTWEDTPIRLTLPQLEPTEGWAIFAIRGATSLDVTRTTLTIENRDNSGIVWHYNVSAFLLERDDMSRLRMPKDGDRPTPSRSQARPAIRLTATVVRGQANLLRMDEMAAFKLTWTDGLFSSDQLMFDLNGADDREVDGAMQVELTRVTARAAGGLARVNLAGRMFPVPLQLSMNSCIVICEPSIPLVEHRGVSDREGVDGLLRMTGQGNAYPALWPEANNPPLRDRTAWSVHFGDAESIDVSFSDDESWKDFGPGTVVAWRSERPTELPVHEHRPFDYQVERTDTNPAEQAGFADGVLAK